MNKAQILAVLIVLVSVSGVALSVGNGVRVGDTALLWQMIRTQPDINARIPVFFTDRVCLSGTILIAAAAGGDRAVVEELLARGADHRVRLEQQTAREAAVVYQTTLGEQNIEGFNARALAWLFRYNDIAQTLDRRHKAFEVSAAPVVTQVVDAMQSTWLGKALLAKMIS